MYPARSDLSTTRPWDRASRPAAPRFQP
jgi:hypothetical protein